MLFVVANNQWAISVPRRAQTRAATLAQKAIGAGIGCEQVDGNDVIALRQAAGEALADIRSGQGPYLIEALTYRLSDHTTADDARRYRDDEEVSARWKSEPVARLRAFMTAKDWWTSADEQHLLEDCAARVAAAADAFLAMPAEPPAAMFEHLFAEVPPALADQYAVLKNKEVPGNG